MTNIMTNKNPYLTNEMLEYLQEQGFYNTGNVVGATLFKKADKALYIQGSTMRFRFYDGLTLESSFDERFDFTGLENLSIEQFKSLLAGLGFTSRQKETLLTFRGKRCDVLQAVKMIATKSIIMFFIITFCSCAYHQEMYKQPGYWSYDNCVYHFHPKGESVLIQPETLSTTDPFFAIRIINVKGKKHFNYTNP